MPRQDSVFIRLVQEDEDPTERNTPLYDEQTKALSGLGLRSRIRELITPTQMSQDLMPLIGLIDEIGLEGLGRPNINDIHRAFFDVFSRTQINDKRTIEVFNNLTRFEIDYSRKQYNLVHLLLLLNKFKGLSIEFEVERELREAIVETIADCGREGIINPLLGMFRPEEFTNQDLKDKAAEALMNAARVCHERRSKSSLRHLRDNLEGLPLGKAQRKGIKETLAASDIRRNPIAKDGLVLRIKRSIERLWPKRSDGRSPEHHKKKTIT